MIVYMQCPTTGDMRGCQVREIVCEEYRVNDYRWPGITINNSVCEALGLPRPHSVRSCQGFVCNFGVWVPDRSQVIGAYRAGGSIFNAMCMLPPLVLKARHLSGSAFCKHDIGMPEQALGWLPLGLGLVVEDEPSELSCLCAIIRLWNSLSSY